MHCDREAIAAYTDHKYVQMRYSLSLKEALIALLVARLPFVRKVTGSNPGGDNWKSFKVSKFLCLNEDTLAIEVCSKLKS